jgi:TonB family protein
MYLDFEDYRPDIPRVPSPISRREGVLLSIIVHALLVIGVLILPRAFPSNEPQQVVPANEPVRYVQMTPLVDRMKQPRLQVEHSDADRRSATRERAPDAVNPLPLSRGNSPEKTEGAREEKAAGPDTPQPPAMSAARETPPPPAGDATAIPLPAPPPPTPASGNLGSALRNLERYLQDENFNNQKGGQTDLDADIQFDSKGVEFGPWLRRFVARVKRNWFVPQAAWTLKGRVVIQFYVLKDGTILDIRVVQPSGIDAFNTAAVNALKMSNPVAALPPEYPTDRVFFTVTFHYNEGL